MARKKRAWSNQVGKIPAVPEELSERFQEVLREVDKLRTHEETGEPVTMADLQNEWVALEQEAEFAELEEYKRNVKFDALERRILEELERVKAVAGTDMWRGDSKTFSPKYSPRPKIVNAMALMQWIKDTGQSDVLTLPKSRLKSIIAEIYDTDAAAAMTPAQRAALKAGDPASGVPPPGVEVYLDKGVNHTTVGSRGPRSRRSREDDDSDGPF